jgi:DNA-binding GntR family transcriptional regulator
MQVRQYATIRIMSRITSESRAEWPAQKLPPVVRHQTGGRTSDRVYDELVAAIRELRLPPGTSLSETELAQQLEVSRTPLREAIARLADNGLVQVVPQVGTRVALISLREVDEARFVRESLELAAFEAACTIPDRDVSALRDLLASQEDCLRSGDLPGFFAADEALHATIFSISGYPGAWRAVQRTKLQLDRLRRLSLPEPSPIRELIDEHRLIVDALERGDTIAGRDHISTHARRVLRYQDPLRHAYPNYFTE